MKSTIIVSAILSLCRFGDHVLLFSGSTAMMLMFEASFSQISCFFVFLFLFFTPPTDPKSGKSIDTIRIKRGWPKPYGFFLGFLTALLLCISVFLSFVYLFCFFAGEINWNGNLFPDPLCLIPFLRFSSAHIKIRSAGIYWPQWQWGGVRLVTALRFTRKLSNGRKHKEKRRWTYYSHLDIKYHLWWNLSPLPVQGSELSQGVDVNYVMLCLFVAGTGFTRTFLQLRSPPPSSQPGETDDVLYGNKEKLFSICPTPYSRASVTAALQTTPHPGPEGLWLHGE